MVILFIAGMLTIEITLSNPEKQREPEICKFLREALEGNPRFCHLFADIRISGIVPRNSISFTLCVNQWKLPDDCVNYMTMGS